MKTLKISQEQNKKYQQNMEGVGRSNLLLSRTFSVCFQLKYMMI